MNKAAAIVVCILLLLPGLSAAGQPDTGLVTVVPEETDEILANPGMGWQTFHHTSQEDRNLPSWIPSTVHYARWGWGALEPQPGEINTDFLDKVLQETRHCGQQLAFRVMCCSTTKDQPYHPQWLSQIGGRVLPCDRNDVSPLEIPDLDHPIVLQKHLDFIQRLGERYDGHRDIDHIDLGSIGWWGEWHLSGSRSCKLPSWESRQKVVDAYLGAFKKTPLLMLIGGRECLTYAAQHGTGWRADCLGDLGGFSQTWCHMRNAYPIFIQQCGIQDTWKTAPIAWETCWDMRKWVREGWSLRWIFNYALALHGSYVNNKSAPLPDEPQVRPELERFLRRLGYRLVLRELKHAETVKAGGPLALSMQWQNIGSAPCYRPYRLAYRLSNAAGYQKVIASKVTVHRWLPGSIDLFSDEFFKNPRDLPPGELVEVSDRPVLPADLPAGSYALSIGVVGDDEKPLLRLAIKGRAEDGWYPLSTVRAVR